MSKLKTLENVVLEVLENDIASRDDDFILLLEVCNRTGADIAGRAFAYAMAHHKELGIPNWKSVERCRRKIQARRPDLISPEAAKKRLEAKEAYTEYARTS